MSADVLELGNTSDDDWQFAGQQLSHPNDDVMPPADNKVPVPEKPTTWPERLITRSYKGLTIPAQIAGKVSRHEIHVAINSTVGLAYVAQNEDACQLAATSNQAPCYVINQTAPLVLSGYNGPLWCVVVGDPAAIVSVAEVN